MSTGYVYDTTAGQWVEASSVESVCPETVKVVGYNVLTDAFFGKEPGSFRSHMLCHGERYEAVAAVLQEQDADVIGLNEVTQRFLDILLATDWVRAAHTASIIVQHNAPFGNLLLSKFGFAKLDTTTPLATGISRYPHVGTIPFGKKTACFVCAHFTAYGSYQERRRVEFAGVMARSDVQEANAVVIFGDLNYHSERENENTPLGLIDVWTAVHGDRPGYTFDTVRNTMNQEILPHFNMLTQIQMRLDRVFVLDDESLFDLGASAIEIIGDSPVHPMSAKEKRKAPRKKSPLYWNVLTLPFSVGNAAISLLGDLGGVNLTRDPKRYLFPSDHFGLSATLKMCWECET